MKYKKSMIAYNIGGDVIICPHPDREGISRGYDMTVGSCFLELKSMGDEEIKLIMMLDFHAMIVRDGVDPQVAHRAFMNLDEYRAVIAEDIGAE